MSNTASSPGNAGFAAHNVVATYPSPNEARAALTTLERHGIEGADIELFGPGMAPAEAPVTNDEQRDVDLAAAGHVGKRFTVISAIVAVVGAGLGGVLGYLVAGDTTGLVVGVVGGVIVGGILGFLYGGYTNLPTNEQWGDTFYGNGETCLAVRSDDRGEIDAAVDALKGTDAKRVATCGRDGQLRDVG